MKDSQILGFCKKNGIRLPLSWRHSCQAVRYHNKGESKKHFMYKAEIAHELMSRGQTIFTELAFDYSRIHSAKRHKYPTTDLLWLDEKIILEFETEWTPEKRELKFNQFKDFNCFVFDIQKISVEEILEKIGADKK